MRNQGFGKEIKRLKRRVLKDLKIKED